MTDWFKSIIKCVRLRLTEAAESSTNKAKLEMRMSIHFKIN